MANILSQQEIDELLKSMNKEDGAPAAPGAPAAQPAAPVAAPQAGPEAQGAPQAGPEAQGAPQAGPAPTPQTGAEAQAQPAAQAQPEAQAQQPPAAQPPAQPEPRSAVFPTPDELEPIGEAASGGPGEPRVMPYDFKRANRFSKEQLRALQTVFGDFSRQLAGQLTAILRTRCDCALAEISEQSFSAYNKQLPTPVVLGVLSAEPLYGNLLMGMSPEVAYMIISRLLGGITGGVDRGKQFTEIELTLIGRVLRQIMPVFGESWEKLCKVEPRLERVETNPQFVQIIASNEPVAVVRMNLTVGEERGEVNLCIPHLAVKPIANQLNNWFFFSGDGEHQVDERISERVVDTTVTLTAYFEETTATVVDILNLQVGDVIQLDQRVDQPVKIKVEQVPKFYAKIGTLRSKCAIQIVDTIEGEANNE